MRLGILFVLVATLLGSVPPLDDGAPEMPAKILRSLDNTAQTLARSGRSDEVAELIEILAALGHPPRSIEKLEAKCLKAAERARNRDDAQPRAARKIATAAADLAALLPGLDSEVRIGLARLIVRLDSAEAGAQEALGRELHDRIWGPPEAPAGRKQRGAIEMAIQTVRAMNFEIETGASDLPFFEELLGHPGSMARWNTLVLHSVWSEKRARVVLEDVLRALALSRFLRGHGFALPDGESGNLLDSGRTFVHVATEKQYQQTIDTFLAKDVIKEKDAAEARLMGGWITQYEGRAVYLDHSTCEAGLKATILGNRGQRWPFFDYDGRALPCLTAGHLNWLCLTLFGASLPGYAWYEVSEERAAHENRRYAGRNADEDRERTIALRLTKSSLVGCRSWLARLARDRQDPPMARCVELDKVGKVDGAFLLKSTIVAEYLHERSLLDRLLAQTAMVDGDEDDAQSTRPASKEMQAKVKAGAGWEEIFAAASGESLDAFDARWRAWLLPEPPGLAQRLALTVPAADTLSSGEERILIYLDRLRQAAWDGYRLGAYDPLKIEPALSKGAYAHAAYLDKHPDQAASWPEAHEEFSDREGFSPEGCRAGLHSVIAPGRYADDPEGAVDAWMGTFYHRTPLLNPGLVRVGWGATKGCAVLDVGSLVLPTEMDAFIVWPPRNGEDLPRSFVSELPNPVPGEDQSNWGYPITLQRFTEEGEPRVVLRLFEGRAVDDGKVVDCHFSTPSEPTNTELAPANDFCLIPKKRLEANTTYTVEAHDVLSDKKIVWHFTTGK